MGVINKGILGGFSGTVGNVVGSTWKGITYMKSQPSKRSTSPSPKQQDQQAKFSAAMKYVSSMTGLVMVSFRNYAVKMTGVNNAFSYTLKHAVTGVFPNYTVDYSMALISRGDLPNATNPAAAEANNTISFTWTDNTGIGKAKATDQAVLAVYCPALNQTLYSTAGQPRSGGVDKIDATLFTGQVVETYLGFISEDGKDIANSVYIGQLTVNP